MKNIPKLLEVKNNSIVGQGGGKSGAGAAGAIEASDNLISKAHIVVVDLLGEGEIGGLVGAADRKGCSIFLNGIPLQNQDGRYNYRNQTGITVKTKAGETLPPDINSDRQFTDIEWETRVGLPKQATLKNIPIVETPYPLPTDGSIVTYDTPVTFLLNQLDATSAKVILSFPRLSVMDKTNGNINRSEVKYRIEISTDGWNTSAIATDFTLTGKCSSTYQRSHTFILEPLPVGSIGWSFKVSKTTNHTGSQYQDDIYFTSLTAVIDASLSYDNSALIAIGMDPLTFSTIPRREYLVDGLKVRVPRLSLDGTWNFLDYDMAVSSNPAWVLYDLLTNERYGLGNYIKSHDIGITDLYRISKYCDGLVPNGYKTYGGIDILEKRFQINTVIQQQAEAYRLISDITSVFRGMAYWGGGKVNFTCDMPTLPSAIFTNANVIDGAFNYTGSARKDKHSAVLVTWNDPNYRYRQQIEYIEDADLIKKLGYRTTQTVAFGCISRSQAHRVGRWLLYTEAYETNLISFKTGIEGGLIFPGEVIEIHDQYRSGVRFGGRITSLNAATRIVTIDSALPEKYNNGNGATIVTGGLKINITRVDGNKQELTVSAISEDRTQIYVTEYFNVVDFDSNAVFIISNSNAALLNPMKARVMGIVQETNAFEFTLTCVEHNPAKYENIENGLSLQLPITSSLSSNLTTTIGDLVIAEYTKFIAPRVLAYAVLISWSSNAGKYTLAYRISTPIRDVSLPAIKDVRGVDVYPEILDLNGDKIYTVTEWIQIDLINQNFYEVIGGFEVDSVIDVAIYGTYPVTGENTPTVSATYTILGAMSEELRIKAPLNFIAQTPTSGYNSIYLSWDNPIDKVSVGTAIYMSSTNNEGLAAIYATVAGDFFMVPDLPMNSTWYFWAESIDTLGNHSYKTNHNPPAIATGIQGHTQISYGDLMKKMSDDLFLSLSAADKFTFQSDLIGDVVDSKVLTAITNGLTSTIQDLVLAATGDLNSSAYLLQLNAILDSLPGRVREAVDTYTNQKLVDFQSSGNLDLSYTNNKIQELLLSSEVKSDNLLEQAIYSKRLEDGLATTFRDVFDRIAVYEKKYFNMSTAQEGILRTVESLAIDSSKGTAAIQKAEEVRVGELSAIANAFKQVISKVGEVTARITTSEQTRSTNDSALAQQISTVQAQIEGVAEVAVIASKRALVGWCEIGGVERLDLDTEALCVAQSANGWHKGALGTAIDGIKAQSTVAGGLNIADSVQTTFASAGVNTSIGIFKSGVNVIANNAAAKAQTAEFAAAGIFCKYSDTSFDPFEIDDATLKNIANSPITLDTYCKTNGKSKNPLSVQSNWAAQSGAYAQRLENLMSGNINARNTDGTLKPFAQIVVDAITDSSDAGSSATKKEALKSLTGGLSAIVNNAASVMTGAHCVKKDSSGNIISYLTQFTTQATCEAVINGGSWINEGAVATAIRQVQAVSDDVSTISKISEALNTRVAALAPAGTPQTNYSNLAERVYKMGVDIGDASASITHIQTGAVGYCFYNGVANTTFASKALCEAAVGIGGVHGVWKDASLTANSIEQFSGFMNSLPLVTGSSVKPSNFALAIQNTITNALADPSNTATESEKLANSTFSKLVNSITAAKSNMAASVKHEITTQIGYCVVAAGTLDVDVCDNKYVCACPVNKKSDGKTTTQYLTTDLTAGLSVGLGGVWHDGALASIVTGMSVASQLGSSSDGTLVSAIGSALDEKYLKDQTMYQYNTDGSLTYQYTGAPLVNGVLNYKNPPIGAVFPLDAYGNKIKIAVPGSIALLGKNLNTLTVSIDGNTAAINESKTVMVGVCQTNAKIWNAASGTYVTNTAAIGNEQYDFSLDLSGCVSSVKNPLAWNTSVWQSKATAASLNKQIASKFGGISTTLSSVSSDIDGIKNTASMQLNAPTNISIKRADGTTETVQSYAGFVVKQNTNATGVVHSDFIIQADRFAITNNTGISLNAAYDSTSTSEAGVIFPFIMENGKVTINAATIRGTGLTDIANKLILTDKFVSNDSVELADAIIKSLATQTALKTAISTAAVAGQSTTIFTQVLEKFHVAKGDAITETQIDGSWLLGGTIAGNKIAAGTIIEAPILNAAVITNGFYLSNPSYQYNAYKQVESIKAVFSGLIGPTSWRRPDDFHIIGRFYGEALMGDVTYLTGINTMNGQLNSKVGRIKSGSGLIFNIKGQVQIPFYAIEPDKNSQWKSTGLMPYLQRTLGATYQTNETLALHPMLCLYYRKIPTNGGVSDWTFVKRIKLQDQTSPVNSPMYYYSIIVPQIGEPDTYDKALHSIDDSYDYPHFIVDESFLFPYSMGMSDTFEFSVRPFEHTFNPTNLILPVGREYPPVLDINKIISGFYFNNAVTSGPISNAFAVKQAVWSPMWNAPNIRTDDVASLEGDLTIFVNNI